MEMGWLDLSGRNLIERPLAKGTSLTGWKNEKKYSYFRVDRLDRGGWYCTIKGLEDCHFQLYQMEGITAHMGRGVVWGELPLAPVETFYDVLQPYVIERPIERNGSLFCLELEASKAGGFQGAIEIHQENECLGSLSITFEVLGISLPEESRFGLELWQYPFAVARYYGISPEDYFKATHLARITESLTCYAEAGGDTVVTTIVHDPWNHQTYDTYPSLVTWQQKGDSFTFDFTWFDQYVALNFALGIDRKIKCFSLLPWEDKIYYLDEAGVLQEKICPVDSPEWRRIWGIFLKAFIQHLEEKNWFDRTYMAIDERPAEILISVLALLKEYLNRKGERLKVSCAMDYQTFDQKLLDQVADLSIGQSHLGDKEAFRQICQERRVKGLFTSIYNCVGDYPAMFLYSHPLESQWIIWNAAAFGADGFLRWALDAWVEDPLVNGSHWYWESGDPFLIYPGKVGAVSSIRFQHMKQGLADLRKYDYLKNQGEDYVWALEQFLMELPKLEGKENAYGAKIPRAKVETETLVQQMQKIQDLLQAGTQAYLKESEK